jgi:hypothetical protein
MGPGVSLALPDHDARFQCCSGSNDSLLPGLSPTRGHIPLTNPGGASASLYPFFFPEAPASGYKAELRDPAPKGGGMIPFLLIVIVLGGIVRYLTSPAYYRFIAEILDPKIY